MNTEQESRSSDKAKLFHDNKKASKKTFTGNKMEMVAWQKSAKCFVIQDCYWAMKLVMGPASLFDVKKTVNWSSTTNF